ncbi:MAG: response regulator [Candidatus Omnitrophota bacterium]
MCFKSILKRIKGEKDPLYPLAGKKVLIVEDDATQRAYAQKILAKQGFSVLIAENGEKGLEIAQAQSPHLIILDVVLPGIHGDEACRRLKADSRTKDIPVIFLTSMDEPKDVITHYEVGGEIHLTKPINAKELIRQVEITIKEFSPV